MKTSSRSFWRLDYPTDAILEQMIANSSVICADRDFPLSLSVGDCILLARFDEAVAAGLIKALGIVSEISRSSGLPVVKWRRMSETLYPSIQGKQFWTQSKPYFEFAKNPVKRYRLNELLERHLPDVPPQSTVYIDSSFENESVRNGLASGLGGYVYVIKSPYGYKIGKTKRMRDRAQLFSVKLPFPIEIVHFAWFDNYSVAESQFHQMFKSKRLDGEWFQLGEGDLATIKRFRHDSSPTSLR